MVSFMKEMNMRIFTTGLRLILKFFTHLKSYFNFEGYIGGTEYKFENNLININETHTHVYTRFGFIIDTSARYKFRVPNFEGAFIRVLDEGKGVNPDRNSLDLLDYQQDAFKEHSHTIYGEEDRVGGGGVISVLNHKEQKPPTTEQTSSTGSNETRPKNVQLCAYIRYR